MSLTLDEVRQIRFRMTRRGESGYQVGDVDSFIDKVELTFDEFDKERERLHRELDSASGTAVQPEGTDDQELRSTVEGKDREIEQLKAEIERLSGVIGSSGNASAAQEAAEGRIRELSAENDSLRNQLEQVRTEFDRVRTEHVTSGAASGTEHLVVTASAEAAPAVTRLLQMATDQATTLVDEAQTEAERKIYEAEERATEIKTDARTKADRVESEARINAEQATREADERAAALDAETAERRRDLFADLEREQSELTDKVDALRDFESSYRQNLTGSLQRLLGSLNEDRPEPLGVPELAQKRSETPRLDALANADQS
ncbi:DivIVA domain-containing protein [Tessaracoccus bendigoensis DSM 12906]|uniref:Cell wall synthesis protein Wag31 n=1 Tax=Tessaracoccus bendigoensis DSM 12906 TaxID=1123357 RepID=A0A1M6APW4_9ACTN|nr:DivIVA domain-containing protein [Tessaracoccus bendigoensis]SHI38378.1 DivIVA domain-containing protein [Tessaracoccus bendigoensis DSM 12906]